MRKQRLKGAVERSRRAKRERRSEVTPRCLQRGCSLLRSDVVEQNARPAFLLEKTKEKIIDLSLDTQPGVSLARSKAC